jgi:hypothetical protein
MERALLSREGMRPPFLATLLAASLFPALAAAAPETVNPKEPQHGVDVVGQADLGAVMSSRRSGSEGSVGIGLRALYRLTPRLALGASATRTLSSYSSTEQLITDGNYYATEGTALWRAGGVVQYDYAVLGPFRAWIAGEVGLAFASDHFVATNPDFTSHAMTDTRVAPWIGASTGAEIRPIRYLSIGAHAGALHAALGSAVAAGASIPGAAQSLYGGLDLGFHYPVD